MKHIFVFPMIVVLLTATLIGCSGKNQNSTIVEILDVFLAPNSTIKLRVDNSSLKPKLRVDNQFCFKKSLF